MADSGQDENIVPESTNIDSNGGGVGQNYFDNMASLATAAQQQAPYAAQQASPQHAAALDPMFFINDPQQQQPQQQFYPQQGFVHGGSVSYTPEQLQQALTQQLTGGEMEFQNLVNQIRYSNPQFQQHLQALQRGQQLAQAQQGNTQPSANPQSPGYLRNYTHQQLGQPEGLGISTSSQMDVDRGTSRDVESVPPSTKPAATSTVRTVPDRTLTKSRSDFRPKTAIPQDLTAEEYAGQCIQAAIASRLSPYFLHRGEYELLREHISHHQVTTYLHIRNGILRLWQRNPLVSVTREEAAGCAKDYRFFDVAEVAYDWLVRNGYINFGCIEVPNAAPSSFSPAKRRKTIVVIGAGMAGLGCARQLGGLFSQFGDKLPPSEGLPKVIVLEARGRLGGRVYSHPLKNQKGLALPEGKRGTADLGAQVITGFDNGNPMGVLIRGQLALHYHSLKDNSVLYDSDGTPANRERDILVEKLYNDILDRVSIFKQRPALPKTVEGDRALIDAGKDPSGEVGKTIAEVEENEVVLPPLPASAGSHNNAADESFSAGVDKLTGKPSTATGSSARIPAAEQVRNLGWSLKPDMTGKETISLEPLGTDPRFPTLGKTMDNVLQQYQRLLDFTPLDMRMMNWHYANLEYANAANVDSLCLGHWDQDDGNEFRGAHAMLIGGYTQVPRGLWLAPQKLDVRTKHVVRKISYSTDMANEGVTRIECENGQILEADKVVVTLPLGVLKAGAVEFDPPLPEWKTGAVERLGYGLLNKVVLVYDEAFWDVDNDMVGLLREPMSDPNIQESYEANRGQWDTSLITAAVSAEFAGRFYMFWNCMKSSGKPVLVALMAGDAAIQTERESDDAIIDEATAALQKMYPDKAVLRPAETIITRWRKDPYSRGSYSYMGPEATADDYDLMAKPVGNTLYFAGEASCKSHPATVHGAYISGMQAAADITDSILGKINVPSPLIPPKPKPDSAYGSLAGGKRKAENSALERSRELRQQRLEAHENALNQALLDALGERPAKPGRSGANPFLLFQKDHWFVCKANCDEARKKATNNQEAKATRNEVRAALGQMWRDASEEVKRPYLAETENNKKNNAAGANEFKKKMKEWDTAATKFKQEWKEKNPSHPSEEEVQASKEADMERAEIKRSRKLNGYIDESEDEE